VVSEHDTSDRSATRERHLKGVSLHLAGDRAGDGETRLRVVSPRRQDQGGSTSTLLVSSLWVEREPYQVPSVGDVRPRYHASCPAGDPQSASPCRLRGVILATSWSSEYVGRAAVTTIAPPLTDASTVSPSPRRASSATAFGSRRPRLLPTAQSVSMSSCIYNEYTIEVSRPERLVLDNEASRRDYPGLLSGPDRPTPPRRHSQVTGPRRLGGLLVPRFVAAVRLERDHEPAEQQNDLQRHEHERWGARGAPLVGAGREHSEQAEDGREPPRQRDEYRPIPCPRWWARTMARPATNIRTPDR
jgi:hypothetical protein